MGKCCIRNGLLIKYAQFKNVNEMLYVVYQETVLAVLSMIILRTVNDVRSPRSI